MATGTTAIRSPTDDIKNHTIVLRQLKEVAEVGQRLRGDPTDSFVKVSELVNAGLARFTNNQIQPPESSSSGTFTIVVQDSITGAGTAASPLQLSGDSAAPGNNMVYGTNASGVKGWYTGGGGGSTTLAGLSDVSISSPTSGQVLTYNASTGKWSNPTGTVLDLPPATHTAWDDEFTGTALDTTGSRFAGANAWSYLSGTSWSVTNLTEANSWLRAPGTSGTHASFVAKQPLPASGAWCFVMKLIGPYAGQSYYSMGLGVLNNTASTANLYHIFGFNNTLYQQVNNYNPTTGAIVFNANPTSIAWTTTAWYYVAIYYPGSGTTYTMGYSTLATQLQLGQNPLPTEYASSVTGMPTGFTQHSTFSLSGATHICITEVDSADVNYVDWFRRTL